MPFNQDESWLERIWFWSLQMGFKPLAKLVKFKSHSCWSSSLFWLPDMTTNVLTCSYWYSKILKRIQPSIVCDPHNKITVGSISDGSCNVKNSLKSLHCFCSRSCWQNQNKEQPGSLLGVGKDASMTGWSTTNTLMHVLGPSTVLSHSYSLDTCLKCPLCSTDHWTPLRHWHILQNKCVLTVSLCVVLED